MWHRLRRTSRVMVLVTVVRRSGLNLTAGLGVAAGSAHDRQGSRSGAHGKYKDEALAGGVPGG